MEREQFYAEAKGLIEAVNAFATEHALAGIARADHVGYKCDTRKMYEELREMLEPESAFVYQSYISGRRIAVIKLNQPFETALGPVSTLELNDQKPDNSQRRGFDHVEVYPVSTSYETLVEKLRVQGAELEEVVRPHHTTYDIALGGPFKLKLTREPLVEKIKRDEMT